MMRKNWSPSFLLLLACAFVATPAGASAMRSFVASYGLDSNPCTLASPCRTFMGAIAATTSGGEVVVLDSAGYGPPVTITQSVAITAPPGVYAGITVSSGTGVTIATSGVSVTLRGLTIDGQGGGYGIDMTAGSVLNVVRCVIIGFSTVGIHVNTAARVLIDDTLVMEDPEYGIYLDGGSSTTILRSSVTGSTGASTGGFGVYANASTGGTRVSISDSNFSGNQVGIFSFSNLASATVQVSVTRSTISGSTRGVAAESFLGNALLTIGASTVTGSSFGLWQSTANTGIATLETLGDNVVRQNATQTSGVITAVSLM